MIAFRLLNIAARRYSADTENRGAAVRAMLINAVRLARAEIGERETESLLDAAVAEPRGSAEP